MTPFSRGSRSSLTITEDELDALLGNARKPRPSKRGNQPTVYEGRTYRSKAEARHARQLDLEVAAGAVLRWEPEVTLPLIVNGLVVARHRVDFMVDRPTQRELHEVKGIINPKDVPFRLWLMKVHLLQALRPDWVYQVYLTDGSRWDIPPMKREVTL